MKYAWAVESHVGLVREGNEDAYSPAMDDAADGPVLIAVADGMGGHTAGEVASRLAIEAATKHDIESGEDPRRRVEMANEAVIAAVADDPMLSGMGTTLTVGLFDTDGVLRVGHVGDSRAYLKRGEDLRLLTVDDTVVEELLRSGHISEGEARNHPRRHFLTQSIGMPHIDVAVIEEQLSEGDRVLLCTDGLTNMVDDDEIRRLLGEAESPAEAAWLLIDAANAAGGHDNTTVAVVDVTR